MLNPPAEFWARASVNSPIKLGEFLTEEACLAEIMRLCGAKVCEACGQAGKFVPAAKHRAFSCTGCGHKVYPCQGTPFSKPHPPLSHWFRAIDARARGCSISPRELTRELRTSRLLAEHISARVSALEEEGPRGTPPVDWFDAVAAFTAERLHAERTIRLQPRGNEVAETAWRTLLSLTHPVDLTRRPLVGSTLIALLVCTAIGIGWLIVPDEQEEDPDLTGATAILSLASDQPVILVSPDLADQFYDVTDAEPAPSSPLAPVIKLAPPGIELKRVPLADARPITRPSVKLAPSVGKSILQGDLTDARRRASDRPELAAYASLATALEGGQAHDPDELLVFGPMRIRRYLVEKIVRAARITSMDPVLLMAIADKESSFATEVQAQTSSATGLFQFIEKTWLGVVRDFGSAYGLERDARLCAGDLPPADRLRILTLRRDAYLSAVFAAEMLKRDGDRIARRLGRPLTGGETYLVHFLGPDGAERLISRAVEAPNTAAADILPRPAEANKPIFYSSANDGTVRRLSVSAVRDKFETMIGLRLSRYRNVHTLTRTENATEPGSSDPPKPPP